MTEQTLEDLEMLLEKVVRRVLNSEFLPKLSKSDPVLDPEMILSRKEVQAVLKVSYPTVVKLTRNGILKGKSVGGKYKYKASDVYRIFDQKSPLKK